MKIKISSKFTPEGKEYIEWSLSDGPEEVERVCGYSTDLIVAFTKILEWRERIARDYQGEITIGESSYDSNEGQLFNNLNSETYRTRTQGTQD